MLVEQNSIWFIKYFTLVQCFSTFFDTRHPLDGKVGLKINELQLLAAPLKLSHGILVCRGTPVEKHCESSAFAHISSWLVKLTLDCNRVDIQ